MEAKIVQMSTNPLKTYVDRDFDNEPKRGMLMTEFIHSMTVKSHRSKSYKQLYEGTAKYIRDFSDQNKCIIYTNSVTEEFLEDFVFWLQQKNLRPNTVQGIVSRVKAQVRKAGNYGYAVNRTYDYIVVKGEDSPAIALTMSDITRLYYFKGLSKKQENIRDLFVIGCMTGLRFSDYSTLTLENVSNDLITKKTKKTGALVFIPIHRYVHEIIDRYNGFPAEKNLQYFNRYLKLICKTVGFDDKYVFHRVKGLENTVETYQKWELISSHTARRSFATNMYNSGRFSTIQIMQITGHSSEKSFLRYIKVNREDSARAIASDLYFNQ